VGEETIAKLLPKGLARGSWKGGIHAIPKWNLAIIIPK
jgi:hypothetical protein